MQIYEELVQSGKEDDVTDMAALEETSDIIKSNLFIFMDQKILPLRWRGSGSHSECRNITWVSQARCSF